jgi:hypothetical protein
MAAAPTSSLSVSPVARSSSGLLGFLGFFIRRAPFVWDSMLMKVIRITRDVSYLSNDGYLGD